MPSKEAFERLLRHFGPSPPDLGGPSPCPFAPLDIDVGDLYMKGEAPGEGVEGVKEFLIAREGKYPGALFSWVSVGFGEFLGKGGPNCPFQPSVNNFVGY